MVPLPSRSDESEDIFEAFKDGHFVAKKVRLKGLVVPAAQDDYFGV